MIKFGMLDFDTSHVVEFTKRLNHVGVAEDQFVDGAKIDAFKTNKPAVPPSVTLEIVAFMEAANKSAANHGAGEMVKV